MLSPVSNLAYTFTDVYCAMLPTDIDDDYDDRKLENYWTYFGVILCADGILVDVTADILRA